MAASSTNPTVSRLELAARLRELRIEAGKSIDDAAAELMCSVAKISRMETGGRGVQPRDIRDLCRLYGASSDTRDDLTRLASDARKTAWWQRDFRTIDEQLATFVGLETAATVMRTIEATRVPGLLQTAEFTRSLLPFIRPPGDITTTFIDETVALRERRQKRVESGELQLHAIIDEAALRRPVGDPEVMYRQVGRLLQQAARPNVSLQVIPFDRGPHAGIDGSFQHLSFERIDDMVYVEGLRGDFLIFKAEEVAHYRTVFDDLSRRFALDAEQTIDWLSALHTQLAPPGKGRRRSGTS